MKKFFKSKSAKVLCAALVALIGISVIFFSAGLYPFGDKVFLVSDLNGQYLSFFEYLRQMLTGRASWKYTISKFMGADMAGFTSYYLLSPFNLILLLFEPENVHGAITFIAFAKITACAVTSYLFFSKNDDIFLKNIICSTAYSLCAYSLVYLQNIMWIDGVIALPLIAMGIDDIIHKNKPALYIFSLFFGIFSNYYIGYMLCLFSVIYFLYRAFTAGLKAKPLFYSLCHWAFSSFLAGAMSAFVILPTLSSLEGTSKSGFGMSNLMGMETTAKLTDLATHFLFPETVMRDISSTMPNIYPGIVICLFSALYFLHPKIKLRQKISALFICGIFALSFYFWSPNLVWHGFSMPVLFYNRFSFIFSFFLILFAAEFIEKSALLKKKYLLCAAAVTNFIFLTGYGVANYKRINWPDYSAFKNFYSLTENAVEFIKQKEDGNFYRVEKNYIYGYNDPLIFGYGGMSSYSSGEKIITRRLARNMGYTVSEGRGQNVNGDCLATDSFWGIKYYIIKDDTRRLDSVYQDEYVTVYENPYALPLAIQCSPDIKNISAGEADSETGAALIFSCAFNTDLSLTIPVTGYTLKLENVTADDLGRLSGEGSVNFSISDPAAESKIIYNFTARQTGGLYMNILSSSYGAIDRIIVNGEDKGQYLTVDNFGTCYLDSVQQGQDVQIEIVLLSGMSADEIRIFYDDYNGLETLKNAVEKNSVTVSEFKTDSFTLSGYSEKEDNGIMVMLPYQDGWQFYCNGQNTAPQKVLDTLMYIPVEPGEFVIYCRYVPPMSKEGAAISLSAAAVAGIYIFFLYRSGKKQ